MYSLIGSYTYIFVKEIDFFQKVSVGRGGRGGALLRLRTYVTKMAVTVINVRLAGRTMRTGTERERNL